MTWQDAFREEATELLAYLDQNEQDLPSATRAIRQFMVQTRHKNSEGYSLQKENIMSNAMNFEVMSDADKKKAKIAVKTTDGTHADVSVFDLEHAVETQLHGLRTVVVDRNSYAKAERLMTGPLSGMKVVRAATMTAVIAGVGAVIFAGIWVGATLVIRALAPSPA